MDDSQLLELALACGQSTDLRTNCDRFLTGLTSLLDLSYTSVWVRGELLGDEREAGSAGTEGGAEPSYVQVYARPWSRRDPTELAADHPLAAQVVAERVVSVAAAAIPALGGIATSSPMDAGAFAGYRLEDVGLLLMHSLRRKEPFPDADLHELASIVDGFAVSLEGCLAHRGVSREAVRRRRAETAVRHEKERFRALVENALDMILLLGFDGAVEYASDGARRMLGHEPASLVGRNVFELVHSDEVSTRFQAFVEAARNPGAAFTQEMRLQHADGSWRVVSAAVNNLGVNPSVGGIVMTCHDVTEQRRWVEQLERAQGRAEEANRLKDEFVALVSHELRTPLNGILGLAAVLGRGPLDAEQQRHVEAIRRMTGALGDVVDDILDLAKIEHGKLELEPTPYDVVRCVEDAVEAVAMLAARKGLELGYRIEPPVIERAVGDPRRVRQVLINLLSNAVKFTDQGEVWVVVRTVRVDSGEWEVRFAVEDTGPGIPPDQLDRLFVPFRRLPGSSDDEIAGTGLGLSICKRMAEAMGGRVRAESEVGVGSAFHLELPCAVALATGEEHWAEARERVGGHRILLLHPGGRGVDAFEWLAASWGLELVTVASREAVDAALSTGLPVDVVVADDQLGPDAGPAAVRQVAEAFGFSPPLVELCTVRAEERREGGERGSGLVVEKPVRPERLLHELERALRGPDEAGERAAPPAEPDRRADRKPGPASGELPLTVLVADDDDTNREVARMVLERLGHRVTTAADGRSALEALLDNGVDLAFLDLQMPHLEGTEVAIRARQAGLSVRLVAMTGATGSEAIDRIRGAGFDEMLGKPVDPEAIEDAAHGVVAGLRSAAGDGAPSVDPDQMARLRGLMPHDLLVELVDRFVAGSGGLLAELRDAASGRRLTQARRVGHALRGKALTVGATALAELCAHIEEELRDPGELAGLVRSVETELARAATALERGLLSVDIDG